jgi:hypothetical protein
MSSQTASCDRQDTASSPAPTSLAWALPCYSCCSWAPKPMTINSNSRSIVIPSQASRQLQQINILVYLATICNICTTYTSSDNNSSCVIHSMHVLYYVTFHSSHTQSNTLARMESNTGWGTAPFRGGENKEGNCEMATQVACGHFAFNSMIWPISCRASLLQGGVIQYCAQTHIAPQMGCLDKYTQTHRCVRCQVVQPGSSVIKTV